MFCSKDLLMKVMGFEVVSWPLEVGAIVMNLSAMFGSSKMFVVGCIGDVLWWDLIPTKLMDSIYLIFEDLGVIAEGCKGMETFVWSLDSQLFFEIQVLLVKDLKDLKFIGLSHVSVMREVMIISSYGFGKDEADYWPLKLGVVVIASSTLFGSFMVIVIGSFEVSMDSLLDWSTLASKDVEDGHFGVLTAFLVAYLLFVVCCFYGFLAGFYVLHEIIVMKCAILLGFIFHLLGILGYYPTY
ncbi:hypothetical protein KFK09_003831 [Dendrobium nobile]|uniref:Uncharacterized protein n=1 Tax=Dendrobium nobile TaxID=94219 RepID=A0A8T3C494_DENNO|nr:hypothetical protein KFK09_003831 [Dendrobium nobile]